MFPFFIFPCVVSSCTLFWMGRSWNILKVDVWRLSDHSKPACSLCITSFTSFDRCNSVCLIRVCRWFLRVCVCLSDRRARWVHSPEIESDTGSVCSHYHKADIRTRSRSTLLSSSEQIGQFTWHVTERVVFGFFCLCDIAAFHSFYWDPFALSLLLICSL